MKKKLLIIAALIAAFFISVVFMYNGTNKFYKNTTINNVDVSGLTLKEASNKLTEAWNKDVTLTYEDTAYKVKLNQKYNIDTELRKIHPTYIEKLKYLFGIGNKYTIKMKSKKSEELLREISGLNLCDNKNRTKTKDARVDLSNFDFKPVKEIIGEEVDAERIEDVVLMNVEDGNFTIDLQKEDIVKLPKLTTDSQEFQDLLSYYKENFNYKIEYKVDNQTFTLTPEQLSKMVNYEDGVKIKKKKIKEFVDELANTYNEYHKTYTFRTSTGSYHDVYAVTFGRILNEEKEEEYLSEALKKQKSDSHEVSWSQDKYEDEAGNGGIGNSYIEVSISNQHVWCYKEGECIVSTDCVTGKPGHDTSTGLYTIQYITGPMTLRGTNDDGSKYASPVNCFMPFYGDQGLHGSNHWRSSWGGTIYKRNGSHGCINLPDSAAKTIANNISAGYPIVIY